MEEYRIVIDVRTELPLANEIFNNNEGHVYHYCKTGRVSLYRIKRLTLEKDVIEKAVLVRANTVF